VLECTARRRAAAVARLDPADRGGSLRSSDLDVVVMQLTTSGNRRISSQSVLPRCRPAGLFASWPLLGTADCISSEKREGTLGLLFLTDLKGYSVILGKMLATSLNSFYALTAIFPVLAIPLLLGGIPPMLQCDTRLKLFLASRHADVGAGA
jgi:hypothetical protein